MISSSIDKSFHLSNFNLRYIPKQAITSTHITNLNLEHNQIDSIPKSIRQLKNLVMLNLSDNIIGVIPKTIRDLDNLAYFNSNRNNVFSLSPLKHSKKLHTLEMEHNCLVDIKEIISLRNLVKINLSHNKIKEIPELISNLENLQTLDVSYNCLKELPSNLAQITSLSTLIVSNNTLDTLPPNLSKINWKLLVVENNPLTLIPPQVVMKGTQNILKYLEDLLSGEIENKRMKLMFTGQANVGKTSLLRALRNEIGYVNRVRHFLTGKGKRTSTYGIELGEWSPINSGKHFLFIFFIFYLFSFLFF